MTDTPATDELPKATVRAAELAAHLAARLCHDFISPASAIVSGLDLLEDPTAQDMREDAMQLIASSGRKLAEMLAFCRIAFGASASAQTFDVRELAALAQGVFGHMRAQLDWQVALESAPKPVARALLNLAQLAGQALPTGGVATVRATQEGDTVAIAVEAVGPRARLRPEVLAGLRGDGPGEGLAGQWVQAQYVHLFITDAGGRVFVDAPTKDGQAEDGADKVVFAATIPSVSTAP